MIKMFKLLNLAQNPKLRPIQNIKKIYKSRKFKRYAKTGEGLSICARSDCIADKSGLIQIGEHCEIFGTLISMDEGKITIGDHTCIFEHSVVGSVDSVSIGNCVIISNYVHIYDNNNHPTDPGIRDQMCREGFHTDAWRWTHAVSKPVVIEDNVWIGEYAAILKGVTVGHGAIVASHAVVTKNVPPYAIVAGNPAVVVKELIHV